MAYLLALRSNEIGEGEAQDMKLRVYHQRLTTGEWVDTVGYPCPLPHFPTQFAVVRPPSLNEDTFNPTRWQVIHLHSGLRLSYQQLGSSKTRADAKRSALAEIELVALGEKATPGPWLVMDFRNPRGGRTIQISASGDHTNENAVVHWLGFDAGDRPIKVKAANAVFITALRNFLSTHHAELRKALER